MVDHAYHLTPNHSRRDTAGRLAATSEGDAIIKFEIFEGSFQTERVASIEWQDGVKSGITAIVYTIVHDGRGRATAEITHEDREPMPPPVREAVLEELMQRHKIIHRRKPNPKNKPSPKKSKPARRS
ncbi:MAG: hypothetical protein ACKV0T_03995 [Planctomycetales bacterium]